MNVSEILQKKGYFAVSIDRYASVFEALTLMSEKNIGALLVMGDQKLVGIVSERDYARKIILKGKTSFDTQVNDIMTESPITVGQQDSIDTCMALMSENHFRHLPVLDGDKPVGMISMGDVVKAIIKMQRETIDLLQNYISQ
jgi:CBS domain-containing protein